MASSHGARSSAVRGIPRVIFSMFARECSESPSRNGQPIASASRAPTVDFPDPATPMTTMIMGVGTPQVYHTGGNRSTMTAGGDAMQIGMVGLGRMGANMVRRLMRAGHDCVAY